MFMCERICNHDVPYHPGWVVLLCSCAREFFVSMPLTTLAGSYYYVLVRENFSSQCPLLHPQIYLNCHLEKIQSYLNIRVSSFVGSELYQSSSPVSFLDVFWEYLAYCFNRSKVILFVSSGEWENACNELQRMLIVRSLRPDRVSFTATSFIVNNLGSK